jgi:hypothetical protein
MARFKVATVDGYEAMVEHQRTIEVTEIIRGSHGEPEKRGKIVLFTDDIVVIREG